MWQCSVRTGPRGVCAGAVTVRPQHESQSLDYSGCSVRTCVHEYGEFMEVDRSG